MLQPIHYFLTGLMIIFFICAYIFKNNKPIRIAARIAGLIMLATILAVFIASMNI